ncbi:DMT family transporter [Burkholderia ubonensis]|uniref:Multidrug DMT transporter permease n=1 Tax=Burkholderia ubonensis TaxID=101571 RepID=A0A1R1JIX5_9BURK|nr:DMT family transporter [Burkholderia ubonensis]OMG75335.1 multidrug DMT transporter permease [Burkholderia ubonensis]
MTPTARQHLRANLLMLGAAAIWGSAFVAQRLSLDVIGPFLFTGLRFLLGALVLVPLLALNAASRTHLAALRRAPALLLPGLALGALLATSISLQQIGLQYTRIANAGFISSLYVVLVPLMGVFARHRIGAGTWFGALLAALGLYFLSIDEHFSILYGDWFQLAGAVIIAAHVMAVGHLARRHDPLVLAFLQFATCGVLCVAVGLAVEPLNGAMLRGALPTLLYGGLLSVGVGYTLQVVAQRDAAPAHAAVIFSMEGVFAAIAGWAALGETLTLRALVGCALMLAGLLACQLLPRGDVEKKDEDTVPA